MNFSKFTVARDFPSLATRESGMQAREAVLSALAVHSWVVLDFAGAHPTPSFADELVGKLAVIVGRASFKDTVRIEGVDSATRVLLHHVIARRTLAAADHVSAAVHA